LEVIFPVYTFHATCSPAMQYGITPVFCDSDGSGGMDAKILANLMTKKTKVVIVTHMWGMPCDMHAILKVVRQWPGVLLYEDCSHAHGAAIDGRLVGTFGDGAAWSLQGPKIISGGEGGILLTPHKNIFDMALLNGHYNKRCFSELSPDNPLRKFAGTGVGFKHRSHPLANAIALQQAGELTSFLAVKRHVATLIDECIAPFPFLQRPKRSSQVQPAWYAYVARYDHNAAPNGITRDTFCNLLRQAGVTIVDVPRSTGLVSRESLFSEPATLLPHLYEQDQRFAHGEFPSAAKLYDQAIKFDVCALESQVPVFVEQLAKMSLVAMELLAQDAHTK
jgi:dTDP-4-amino-4,6-dideoxygalactose transaminase